MNATKDKPRNMTDIAEMLGITAQSVSLALRKDRFQSAQLPAAPERRRELRQGYGAV